LADYDLFTLGFCHADDPQSKGIAKTYRNGYAWVVELSARHLWGAKVAGRALETNMP
jgi:hypothetical protein